MYVSVRHVRYILHHSQVTSHHTCHVVQLTVSGVSRPTEAVWRRQSTAAAARLSHKMGKPGSSPTNRQYRHADRQCMDWTL